MWFLLCWLPAGISVVDAAAAVRGCLHLKPHAILFRADVDSVITG